MKKKSLVVLVGPTAVGKTEVAIKVAKQFDTEIVSADSRQFFKEMNLGTAKPTVDELEAVPHHLVNHLSIHEPYTVKDFEEDALEIIADIHSRRALAVLSGGSGLYVQALCKGLDEMPQVPVAIREALMNDLEKEGLASLLQQLKKMDPTYYAIIDKSNPQRIVRALEVCIFTKEPYSSFRTRKSVERPFKVIMVGLQREREELYARIDNRMDGMIKRGLFGEAEMLYKFRHLNALQTVGYSEIFKYLEGAYDYEEAVRLLKRNSRRYAKRQMTWFNRDEETRWFHPCQEEELIAYIAERMEPSEVRG